jgi:hypothetical protein
MKNIVYSCRCDDDVCGATFNIIIAVDDRYDSVLIKHCPLCGHQLRYTINLGERKGNG